jgi:hypothetical protein
MPGLQAEPGAERLYGYSEREAVGSDASIIVPTEKGLNWIIF